MRAGEPVARFNDVTKAEAVYSDLAYEKEPEEIET